MELAGKIKQSKRIQRPRTITMHHSGNHSGQTMRPAFSFRSNPMTKRLRMAFARLAQPRVLLVLGLFAIAFAVVSLQYYTSLAREIDARLAGNSFDNSVGIFSSPFKVSVGDHLPVDELTEYLHAAGYQQSPAADDTNSVGSFVIEG